MCGIVGIFDARGERPIDRRLLQRMNDSQIHRGPDDGGLFTAPGIGLGHRRLSIIDLAGGRQPLFNEDGSIVVVFNGEIYNFQTLAAQLAAAGHRFRTHSDTEVIVHAWEEWGEACVERFRGMFAFVLWDANRQTVFCARDRLGKKPVYYTLLADGTFVVASELKALLVHPGLSRDIDPTAVEDYFAYGYVPDPKSIYRTVAKLAPAHTLTLRRGDAVPRLRQYWTVSFARRRRLSEAEACEELIDRLREAVGIRLISEVPLGAFLSGGVDSSGVVAMMAELSADPVNTCSIAFGEARYDESRYAAMVAERYRTRHTVQRVDPSAYDLVDRLAGVYDEPFADSSAIPTFHVCALGRRTVTVALSGDGGDETFGGYGRYRWHCAEEDVRRRVPAGLRGPLFRTLAAVYPEAEWLPKRLRARQTLRALARTGVESYFLSVAVLGDDLRRRLFSPSLRRELQGYHALELLRRHMDEAPGEAALDRVQYADIRTYLPGDILTKVDRASMAHSLEVRAPLLDHVLIEWACTLPVDFRLRGREGKYILKKALEPLVPREVMYREKMGFAVPIAEWFRGPLRDRVRAALTGPAVTDSGLFDGDCIRALLDQHASGARDHSASLWALVMFESFLRQVHADAADGAPATAPQLQATADVA